MQPAGPSPVGLRPRNAWSPAYSRFRRQDPTGGAARRWHNAPGHGGESRLAGRAWTRPRVELRTYIVEDNATIRDNLIDALQELASVTTLGWAETESAARRWIAAHRGQWDLLIVDLFLKQGSGLGVLEACRDRGREQRVVVLSNYATADMRERCAQLGADAVFDKSNEIDALVDYCLALGEKPPRP